MRVAGIEPTLPAYPVIQFQPPPMRPGRIELSPIAWSRANFADADASSGDRTHAPCLGSRCTATIRYSQNLTGSSISHQNFHRRGLKILEKSGEAIILPLNDGRRIKLSKLMCGAWEAGFAKSRLSSGAPPGNPATSATEGSEKLARTPLIPN